MSTNSTDSINLVEDFRELNLTISEDTSGDKARQLVAYFKASAEKSEELRLHTEDAAEKQFATLMHEAYAASQRIVTNTWEAVHGATLA